MIFLCCACNICPSLRSLQTSINLTIRKHLFKKKQNKTKKKQCYGSSLEHHGKSNYIDLQKNVIVEEFSAPKIG